MGKNKSGKETLSVSDSSSRASLLLYKIYPTLLASIFLLLLKKKKKKKKRIMMDREFTRASKRNMFAP